MTAPVPEFVLVRGVVYHWAWLPARRGGEYCWMRSSLPPEPLNGKRSKWPPRYAEGKLPEHTVITREEAVRIKDESRAQFLGAGQQGAAS